MRNPVQSLRDSGRRLVAVKEIGAVFVIRRSGIEGMLRLRGIASSLGVTSAMLAQAAIEAEKKQQQLDKDIAFVAETGGDEAAQAAIRAQIEGAEKSTRPEDQVAAYIEHVFPLVCSAVESVGELEDLSLDGLLPPDTRLEDVCRDLAEGDEPATFTLPVRLVMADDVDTDANEVSLASLGLSVFPFANAVIEGATSWREAASFRETARTDAHDGRMGEAVRTTPLRNALAGNGSKRAAGNGARSAGHVGRAVR